MSDGPSTRELAERLRDVELSVVHLGACIDAAVHRLDGAREAHAAHARTDDEHAAAMEAAIREMAGSVQRLTGRVGSASTPPAPVALSTVRVGVQAFAALHPVVQVVLLLVAPLLAAAVVLAARVDIPALWSSGG